MTFFVRWRTSVLALERQDLDQRTIFSQATRTILRRSRVGSESGSMLGFGSWGGEGEACAAQEWEWVLRRVREMGFEGKVWNLEGGRLVWWGFEEKNGVANGASNTAAIVKNLRRWQRERERFGCLCVRKNATLYFIPSEFPQDGIKWNTIKTNYSIYKNSLKKWKLENWECPKLFTFITLFIYQTQRFLYPFFTNSILCPNLCLNH